MEAFLIVQRGEDIGRRFDLDTTQLTIGRGGDNDLVLNDPMVSRYHAVLKRQGSRYSMIDLGSSNPVVINDQSLEPGTPQQLTHRDVVFVGKTVFSFQHRAAGMGSSSSSHPTQATTQQPTRPAQQDTAATQVIDRRDFDPPTPPPPSRSAAPVAADADEHTVIAPPPSPSPAPSAMNDDNDKTMISGRDEPSAAPPPLFAPPPPAPVMFDDDATNTGLKPPMQGDRLVGTPPKDDDGDFPTQIIPRR